MENCYNSATVTGADISGGVIGYYINESGDNSEDKYMSHNYYPGGTFSSGIGALYNKDDRQAEDATTGISARSFSNISSSLSTVYKNDDGIYGNNGYPVLVWQEAVDESEKVYMEEIPEDVQRELDALSGGKRRNFTVWTQYRQIIFAKQLYKRCIDNL